MPWRIISVTLIVVGCLLIPLGAVLALGTLMEMDPPYRSPLPHLGVALAGVAIIYLGVLAERFSRRCEPEPPYPSHW